MATLCEDYHRIDLAWLRRRKLLTPGGSCSITWSRCGRTTGSIGIQVGQHDVRLIYRTRPFGGAWRDVEEVMPVIETATCFGGHRRWFGCPRCAKACRVL
jgi:hypothetical protein